MAAVVNCITGMFGGRREARAAAPVPKPLFDQSTPLSIRRIPRTLEQCKELSYEQILEVCQTARQLQDQVLNAEVVIEAQNKILNSESFCKCKSETDCCRKCMKHVDKKVSGPISRFRKSQERVPTLEADLEAMTSRSASMQADLSALQEERDREIRSGKRNKAGELVEYGARYHAIFMANIELREQMDNIRAQIDEQTNLRRQAEADSQLAKGHLAARQLQHEAKVQELHERSISNSRQHNKIQARGKATKKMLKSRIKAKDSQLIQLYEGVSDTPTIHSSPSPPPSTGSLSSALPSFETLVSAIKSTAPVSFALATSPRTPSTTPPATSSPSSRSTSAKTTRQPTSLVKRNSAVIERQCSRLVFDSLAVYNEGSKNSGRSPSIGSEKIRTNRSSQIRHFIRDTAKLNRQKSRAIQYGLSGCSIQSNQDVLLSWHVSNYRSATGISPW